MTPKVPRSVPRACRPSSERFSSRGLTRLFPFPKRPRESAHRSEVSSEPCLRPHTPESSDRGVQTIDSGVFWAWWLNKWRQCGSGGPVVTVPLGAQWPTRAQVPHLSERDQRGAGAAPPGWCETGQNACEWTVQIVKNVQTTKYYISGPSHLSWNWEKCYEIVCNCNLKNQGQCNSLLKALTTK